MGRPYQICARCIMDTTDPEITFDEKGVCSHCRAYDIRAKKELFNDKTSADKLDCLVKQIQKDGQGKDYDCVIGVSGGVDSTMAAYMVKKLGLRPLAVHLDNGWDTELAVQNIERTLRTLRIDLDTYVIDWEEFRDLQMAFLRASVANIEVLTDHAIMAILFHTADKKNIKYIISGGNLTTEAIMAKSWMYDSRDLRHITAIHKTLGTLPIITFPRCSLFSYFNYIFIKGIKYIPILNYINYIKNEAKALIQAELDWRDYGGKHHESIFTRFFQSYYLPKKFNIDKRRAHLSTLICSKQMTREDALQEMQKVLYPAPLFEEDYTFFLKKMKLSVEEFNRIMELPIKTYKDYPSNRFIFRGCPWIIQFVKYCVKPKSLK